jgi:hypothetical protein
MSDAPIKQPGRGGAAPDPVALVDAMRPVFIVGCGHSGTTLLTAMLDSHPHMRSYPGESNLFRFPEPRRKMHLLADLVPAARQAGKTRLVEKTPRHIHCIDSILGTLPSASIVYMVRDGRDVACSLARRVGNMKHGVERWLEDNAVGLAAIEAHPGRIHPLRFEALIDEPEETLRTLCDFLGEPYDAQMLRYHEVDRNWFGSKERFEGDRSFDTQLNGRERGARHIARRNHQINTPIFDPRGEWRNLPAPEQAQLTEALRPMLERFGYVPGA